MSNRLQERERMMQMFRQKLADYESSHRQQAKEYFDNKIGLLAEIENKILPGIVKIKTTNNQQGVGYFHFDKWLASSAHLIDSKNSLEGAQIYFHDGNNEAITAEQSFHRPNENPKSPDLTIINTSISSKCLPTQFPDDVAHNATYIFYVDVHKPFAPNTVKILKLVSMPGELPMAYIAEDGSTPIPGDSGSPIIEARVATGRNPSWQFRVIATLYARHNVAQSRTTAQSSTQSDNEFRILAIPAKQDFETIREIIVTRDMAKRTNEMAQLTNFFKDSQAKVQEKRFTTMSESYEHQATSAVDSYEAGASDLVISEPDDIEKLLGESIVKISESALLDEKQKKLIRKDKKHESTLRNVKTVDPVELEQDFENFLNEIGAIEDFIFSPGDSKLLSPKGYFRIDIQKSNSKPPVWKIDIQDNTGKVKIEGRSVSSVFAIAKVPQGLDDYDFPLIARMLRQSQQTQNDVSNYNELIDNEGFQAN